MPARVKERKLRNTMFDVLEKMAIDIQKRAQANLDNDPVFNWSHNVTGKLRDSVEYKIDRSRAQPKIAVGTPLRYGKKLEFGVPAGTDVPIEELVEWAQLKFDLNEKDARVIAKKVHEKILREGIPAYRFMYYALHDFKRQNGGTGL